MKIKLLFLITVLSTPTMSFATTANEPTNKLQPSNKLISAALTKHLSQQGDFCIGKFNWPIDVSAKDIELGSRDSIQLPVLEKLGLVSASAGNVMRKEDSETDVKVAVKRYSLTDEGKKYYLVKTMPSLAANGKTVVHQGDICVAKLSLDKVVRWDQTKTVNDHLETIATYTYKINATEWAKKSEVQTVFPMVARVINGEGTLQLQQRIRLIDKNWVAVNPWE